MNCATVRDRLPLFLYGDLDARAAGEIHDHLAGCPACRHELAALQQMRRALDGVRVPPLDVDLPRLYQESAARQRRQARRWRRAAVAVGGLAAVLALLLLARIEVRFERQQFVVRWGTPMDTAASATVPPPLGPVVTQQAMPAECKEQLQVMDDLLHALATDVKDRDTEQRLRIARLEARLQELQAQAGRRLYETERQVRALYVAQFQPPPRGD
jgi:hypothetical protein